MIMDFFYAALPWVACGLIVAICAAASFREKKHRDSDGQGDDADDSKQADRRMSATFYTVAVISYVTSLLMLAGKHDNSYSSFTVWLAIGSMFMCIGAAMMNRKK